MKNNKIGRVRTYTELEQEVLKYEKIMDIIGGCAAIVFVTTGVTLLVRHFNFWVIPALVAAVALGVLIRTYVKVKGDS